MKIGIDSYCYHRFFGEVYPEQQPPPRRMSLEDFLRRARDSRLTAFRWSPVSFRATIGATWQA